MFVCKREFCNGTCYCPFFHNENEKTAWDAEFFLYLKKDRSTFIKTRKESECDHYVRRNQQKKYFLSTQNQIESPSSNSHKSFDEHTSNSDSTSTRSRSKSYEETEWDNICQIWGKSSLCTHPKYLFQEEIEESWEDWKLDFKIWNFSR